MQELPFAGGFWESGGEIFGTVYNLSEFDVFNLLRFVLFNGLMVSESF